MERALSVQTLSNTCLSIVRNLLNNSCSLLWSAELHAYASETIAQETKRSTHYYQLHSKLLSLVTQRWEWSEITARDSNVCLSMCAHTWLTGVSARHRMRIPDGQCSRDTVKYLLALLGLASERIWSTMKSGWFSSSQPTPWCKWAEQKPSFTLSKPSTHFIRLFPQHLTHPSWLFIW